MSSPPRETARADLVQMPAKTCSRKLKRGQVKRYMPTGPLFGYMIACPGCGFIELHEHRVAQFVEQHEQLRHTLQSAPCMNCKATITVATGQVVATYA